MRKAFLGILGSIVICVTPLLANAATNITIINNTDSSGTGYAGWSPCSTAAPNHEGVIKPHEAKTIDISPVAIFCGGKDKNCDAYVFLNNNCSGKAVAKVVINANKGIISIPYYDKAHYNVTLNGNVAQIDPA